MSSPPPLLSFRLSQLLPFYLGTVEGLLGAGSQLAGTWVSPCLSLEVSCLRAVAWGQRLYLPPGCGALGCKQSHCSWRRPPSVPPSG